MLRTTEKDFRYYEFYTDSENFVRDVARLLALGMTTDAVIDDEGNIVKPSLPIIDSNWQIVYPAVDKREFPEVEDWDRLTPAEYEAVTKWQLSQITDTAIIKTTTTPKVVDTTTTGFGFDDDTNKSTCTMYLEVYMPPYLCDTETDDPLLQREGKIPEVINRRGFKPEKYNMKVIRNYYHAFFRIFDHINEEGTGPMSNDIDPVTNEIIRWNARSSEWSKLSWYTDFEDVYISELTGKPERGMLDGMVRLPVEPGISMQTKIKLWGNVNRDRLVLACMGSPNIDFGDERYLIGCAYVGAIDSFDFSINDVAGNFGIFTTSSSIPSIGEQTINTRPSRQAGVPVYTTDDNGATIVDKNVPVDTTAGNMYAGASAVGFDLQQLPNTIDINIMDEFKMSLPMLQDVPRETNKADGGDNWGTTYIDSTTVRLSMKIEHIVSKRDGWGNPNRWCINYINVNGVSKNIEVQTSSKNIEITAFTVEVDPENRKNVSIIINTKQLLKEIKTAYGIPVDIVAASFQSLTKVRAAFSLYTQYTTQTGGVTRDKFGNIVSIEYRTRYGENSANSTTDFAMYHTYGKDYFQKHHFMFTSTEEFMQKELYGKSIYTGEYFADRIKVVHGAEGPRGILKGMITIDNSSLYAFDELIVNKDFKKYDDEPEELFVYLPITAPYCPFSNSPNGRHGIGVLKEIRYPIPESDEDYVAYAIRELERKYGDLQYVTDDISLISESEYGVPIAWESSDVTITITDESTKVMCIGKVERPDFDAGDKIVTLTATVTKGSVTKTISFNPIVKKLGITDGQSVVKDIAAIVVSAETKVDIKLPTVGANGSKITWSTSEEAVLSANGEVIRPDTGEEAVVVTLTATVEKGDEIQTKEFPVKVLPWTTTDELEDAKALVVWDTIAGTNASINSVVTDLVFPDTLGRNVAVTWVTSNKSFCSEAGTITRPTYTQGPVIINVTATLEKDGESTTVTISGIRLDPAAITNGEIALDTINKLDSSMFIGTNEALTKITDDMILPTVVVGQLSDYCSIAWSLVDEDGSVITNSPYVTINTKNSVVECVITRPTKEQGNYAAYLKATATSKDSLGGESGTADKRFRIIVLAND